METIPRVLILGGQGRIGSCVARDLLAYTQANLAIAGRHRRLSDPLASHGFGRSRSQFLAVDLDDQETLHKAIQSADLVIHCAGPFKYRDGRVLQHCLETGTNYLDVSDSREFVQKLLSQRDRAKAAGITAIVSSGVFPGISNSMARQGVEQLESVEEIHLSYVVAGSGGAGVTVMRTTFLELQEAFPAWINGQWQSIPPYSDREIVQFPAPYGRSAVYWFNTIEAFTLPHSFPVKTVVTKFGSVPDFYNHLTWATARWFPQRWLQDVQTVASLARISYRMTQVTDRFSGTGIAMRATICGQREGQPARCSLVMSAEDTAAVAGAGTGSIAQLLLSGKLQQPGVWPVEQVLPTAFFQRAMQQRHLEIQTNGLAATC